MNRTEVHILGQAYVVRGEDPPEHVAEIARYVDQKLKEVHSHFPNIPPLKAAILAALSIADELYKSRTAYNQLSEELRKIETSTQSIIRLFE